MRIISVLPAITKLYELVLLQRLEDQIKMRDLISEEQRGFVKGKTCLHNLADLVRIGLRLQEKIQLQIESKAPRKTRSRFFFVFIDLAKAFDTVNRDKLFSLLYFKNVDSTLVNAIRALYSKTVMKV